MERTLAVALAVVAVLAVALQGPAAVASDPGTAGSGPPVGDEAGPTGPPGDGRVESAQPVQMPNTTAKLLLPGGGRPGAGVTGMDLGAAVALDRETTVARLDGSGVERRFEAAATDEERRAVVERGLDRVENRTRELWAAEERAYREYAADSRSLRSLLLTLARIDAEARLYRERVQRLAELSVQVPGLTLRTPFGRQLVGRARSIDWQLQMLTIPVRRHVAETYRGTADGGFVYVAAADQGVVLATMIDGTYAREALRGDRFQRGPGHPIDEGAIVTDAYPWAWNNLLVNPRLDGTIVDIGVWRIQLSHTQGQLLAYLDRSTESVFREVQRLQPERLPNRSTTAEGDGLRVRVNRTYPGGPLKVTVVDNVTGRSVGSVVTVDDHHLGRTGPDGELWTVAPRGAFTVIVRQGPNTVNVSVPAMEFPTAG